MFIVPIQEYERSYSGGLDVPVRSVFQMHFLTTRLAAIATSQDPLPGRFRLHRPVPSHGVFQISTRHGYASIIGSSWENFRGIAIGESCESWSSLIIGMTIPGSDQ